MQCLLLRKLVSQPQTNCLYACYVTGMKSDTCCVLLMCSYKLSSPYGISWCWNAKVQIMLALFMFHFTLGKFPVNEKLPWSSTPIPKSSKLSVPVTCNCPHFLLVNTKCTLFGALQSEHGIGCLNHSLVTLVAIKLKRLSLWEVYVLCNYSLYGS